MRVLLDPFTKLFLVLYTLYLVFAIIGVDCFGGWVNVDSIAIIAEESDEVTLDFIYLNFNDLGSAFVTLFILMVTDT